MKKVKGSKKTTAEVTPAKAEVQATAEVTPEKKVTTTTKGARKAAAKEARKEAKVKEQGIKADALTMAKVETPVKAKAEVTPEKKVTPAKKTTHIQFLRSLVVEVSAGDMQKDAAILRIATNLQNDERYNGKYTDFAAAHKMAKSEFTFTTWEIKNKAAKTAAAPVLEQGAGA